MNITYDYYRIFYYVAKHGGISQGAKALLCGQPNVSKTIQILESQLGCKLLVRSNRGTTLTAEGQKLYDHLRIAFEHIAAAEEEISLQKNIDGGTLSIATTEVALYGSVANALRSFSKRYPNVKVKLTNTTNNNALDILKNGLADFVVLTMHSKLDRHYALTKLKPFRQVLCAPRGLVSLEAGAHAVEAHPYIGLNSSTQTNRFCREYLFSLGINKENNIEVTTESQALLLIEAGVGVGFLSEYLFKKGLERGTVEEIPLKTPPPTRYICIIEDKKRPLSLIAREFVKLL